jgi:NAD(P)-dependent dehydrogenase (short-subunit alcohol dehydrogenase family)
MDLGLKGRKAIVTGATKGIGRAIVDLLASEGVDVGLCARTEDEVQEALRALSSRGVKAVGEALNVRDAEAYAGWLGRTATALGGCDIFVPCVSGGAGMDSEKNWWRNFEIDVLHTVDPMDTSVGQVGRHHQFLCDRDVRRANGIQRHEGAITRETIVAVRRPAECA